MLTKELALRLFDGFTIQRWNDHIRPTALIEMDRHGHKMVIAFILARYEEQAGRRVDWTRVIQGGIFELLRKIALADMKSPIYHQIRDEHPAVYTELNRWVERQYRDIIGSQKLQADLHAFLADDRAYLGPLPHRILKAAGQYATYWEFRIIQPANPHSLETEAISQNLADFEPHLGLAGMRKLVSQQRIARFIDLCGQLRFQIRWGNVSRIPQTSVLGHMLLVAVTAYLLSLGRPRCPRRRANNFFGGLFHDLPEAVTRDIVNPVKTSVRDMPRTLKSIERRLARQAIFPLIEPEWVGQFAYFTEREFDNKIVRDGRVASFGQGAIPAQYNRDRFLPIDGQIIRMADHLAAYLEAHTTRRMGLTIRDMDEAAAHIEKLYRGRQVQGIDIGRLYRDLAG